MSETLRAVNAPAEVYEAADWLRSRHPWVDQLARRITGSGDSGDVRGGQNWVRSDWLDELAGAVNDCAADAVNRVQAPLRRAGALPGP